ncbi:MAG TPA: hypothetical protein VNL35_16740 [Chloroflexota bacterium]|nr:hypothetical protein [Chloroflexota bacterium]
MTAEAQATAKPRVSNAILVEAVAHWWNCACRAGLHPGIAMLAQTLKEEPYLVRQVGDQIQVLGPIARSACIDEQDKERSSFTISGLTWEPCSGALLDDWNPYGAWFVPHETPMCTRYTKHTQGYEDALAALLAAPGAKPFIHQPWQVGRVRCLLLFPNGSFATATDATAQPIMLPLYEMNDEKSLRRGLDELIRERTWPGSR